MKLTARGNRAFDPLASARGSVPSACYTEPRSSGSGRSGVFHGLLKALLLFALACRAETLDRIAVTVGKRVIAESEVLRDVRISALLDRKPVEVTGEIKRKAAERLVDQALILHEAAESRLTLASEDRAQELLAQVKSQYSAEAEYRAALDRYQVTERDLTAHLLAGLRALEFTDVRFRPEVQISDEDLREFYQLFSAGTRRGGAEPAAFEESRAQVQKLLVDQRVIESLDAWLNTTRTQAGVEYRTRVFE